MNEQDKALLEAYMWGFYDELDGKTRVWNSSELLMIRAYNLGREDALVGDEIGSVDYQTNEQILKRILDSNV